MGTAHECSYVKVQLRDRPLRRCLSCAWAAAAGGRAAPMLVPAATKFDASEVLYHRFGRGSRHNTETRNATIARFIPRVICEGPFT